MKGNIRVTVWNEYRHEKKSPDGYREMLQAPHVPEPMEKFGIAD
jgi:hypothetical protein